MIEKQTLYGVDQILAEQGVYIPLELLLAEGRLVYADYESWRGGKANFLEDLLFGDPQEVGRMLVEAAEYALAQGLVAESHEYRCWSGANQRLAYSNSAMRNQSFHCRYVKAEDRPQLDLFLDNAGNTQLHQVIEALCERDGASSRESLERLYDVDPGNVQLGSLEQLVSALEQILLLESHPEAEIGRALTVLETELQPLAMELLGGAGRDYLALFWQRLGVSLKDWSFDETLPTWHVSYCALRVEDWRQVCDSSERDQAWSDPPAELLYRHALASHRLHVDADFLKDWFVLCAKFPVMAENLVKQLSPEWQGLWNAFLDAEPEMEIVDFPAWLLIQRPSLAERLSFDADEMAGMSDAMQAALLLGRQTSGLGEQTLKLRKRLQQASPVLFEHLLAR